MNRRVGVWLLLWLLVGVATPVTSEPRVIELPIRDGVLPRDQRIIRVQQDDQVTFRWTTNHPVTIHLHGYDIERALKPGVPSTMEFQARATGRFPITVHGPGKDKEATLGYLEVHPR